MNLKTMIEKQKKDLSNSNNEKLYNSLLFALQIPSICSRIEFPQTVENTGNDDGKYYRNNGRPWDANLYKAWIRHHAEQLTPIFEDAFSLSDFCDILYELRCQLTHAGLIVFPGHRYYFINEGQTAMTLGDTVFLPISYLCEVIFDAALSIKSLEIKDISLFSEIIIGNDIYQCFLEDVQKVFHNFWKARPDFDQRLYLLYTKLAKHNPQKKYEIEIFFENNPDGFFEDHNLFHNQFIPKDDLIIFDEYNDGVYSIFCRFNRTQYDKMLEIDRTLELYAEEHQPVIKQYLSK